MTTFNFFNKARWLVTIILLTVISIPNVQGAVAGFPVNFTTSNYTGVTVITGRPATWTSNKTLSTNSSGVFFQKQNSGAYYLFTIPVTGFSANDSVTVFLDDVKVSNNTYKMTFQMSYSTNGSSYTNFGDTWTESTTAKDITRGIKIPTAVANGTIYIKILSTSGGGTKGGNHYIKAADITYTAGGTKVTLSKAATTNGSFTMSTSSVTTTSSSGSVTLTCTPANGYQTSSVSATDPATHPGAITYGGSGNSRTVTYPTGHNGSSTITVNFTCVTPTFGTNLSTSTVNYTQGDAATALTVGASANSATINYQWQTSPDNSVWTNTGTNSSANTSITPSTASVGTTYYRCIATNAASGCSATETSNVATITVAAASNFTNGETVFIQANSKDYSGWKDDACVKAWFNASGAGGAAQTTYWLFDATDTDAGKKLFATIVPASGDLNQVTLQRFASNCSDHWNNNGTLTKASASGVNTFRSYGSADNNVAWNGSSTILYLYGSQNSWESSLGTFADQGAGVWTATISNYTPDATSKDYKIKTSYNNGWIGNTGSNNNATLSDMKVGSTYNVTATLNVTTHALTMSKTFVKGTVSFDMQGHGSAISDLTNVTAGSKISAPSPAPSVTGWDFGGWFKEPACTNEWNFATDEVSETMTLYAKWTVKTYTITKTFSNVANAGLPASFTYTGSATTALNSTFTVDGENFILPITIAVTMGGTPLTQGTDYTYDNSTGAFTFSAVITGNIVITATATAKLKSIAITTQPNTRKYLVGETFSSTGAVVTATMGDGSTKAVTGSATWTPASALSAGTSQTVTATYTEAGIEKTATTTIDVYSVTVQKYDETPAEITNASVTVGATGRTLSQSVGSTNYVFNNWSLITASGMALDGSSLTGTPTGDVVVRGNFYKPITITWLKGGMNYATGEPTIEVARGAQWKDLTIPTAPGDATLGACADKFMGWSNSMNVEWVKEDHQSAPGTLFKSVSGNETVITEPITFRAVFATSEGGTSTATFDASDISNLTESPSKTWTHNASGITFTLTGSNSQRYTGGDPYTWTIGYNKAATASHYATITSSTNISQIDINLSDDDYPVHSVTNGTLTTDGSDATKQRITGTFTTTSLYPYCTSQTGVQVRMTSFTVTYANTTYSDYVTVCCTQYDITKASSGSVTGGTFTTSAASACEGAEVTLTATPSDGYAFAGWTVTNTSGGADVTNTVLGAGHAGDNPATMTMPGQAVTVNATFATLTGITVKTAPTKTTYCEGDNFDPTGLVITASFSNSTTLDIPYSGNEAKFTFSPNLSTGLTTGNTSVSISYGGQSTSQAITVNALRTISLTSSGSVTGGTFTADNASACVGATITIEASADDHYSFNSWTIEKAGGGTVTPADASATSTTFTMPDVNVTITASFNESAFKTVVFMNDGNKLFDDGGSASTYDATNKWKQKVYVGETPVVPTALRDGYGVGGDACNDESTTFYGWTKNTWEETVDTEAEIKERTAANTVYKNGATLATVAAGDPIEITYHAVWAKGDVVNINNPLIVKWNAQEINSTPAAGAKADGTESGAKISSNVTLGTAQGSYGYGLSDMGGSDITITITGLDFSGYNSGSISFYAKASQSRNLTIEGSSGGGYSTITSAEATSSASNGKWHEITGISNTTTSLKITYPTGSTHGTFYIGTIRVYGVKTGTYTFTKLTSSNTSGWSTSDWDGYYIIAKGTDASSIALNGGGIHGDCNKAVTVTDGTTITLTDPNMAFQITYEGTNEYSIRGVGSNDYINTSGTPVFGSYSKQNYYAVAYNELSATSSTYLRWNGTRIAVYSNQTQPTLYKILSVLTKFRTTCCEKHAITKGGDTPGTVTGGTFTVDKATACENEEVTLSVTSTTTGYNFDHWQVLQTASPFTDYSSNVSEGGVLTMPSVPVTVTAVFATAHTTTVTLDKQSGTGGTNSVTATVNLAMPAADMPTRSGYAFGGYYSAPNGSGTQYYDADGNSAHVWDDGESDNATLYAKWTASGYTVTLNKEGATTQGTASVSVTFGANTNLTSAITCPSWDGKVFGGYWTTASGDGTRLIDQDGNWLPSVANYTDVNRNWLYANDLELHARWSNVSYTNYRTTCGPEITVTGGPVYLTSYAGCEVLTTGNITVSSENWQSTGGAPKFLSIKFKNMVTGVTYTHTSSSDAGATQKIVNSECRAYYAAGNGGSVADGGYIALPTNGTNPSYDFRIAYTPTAGEYNTRDHYIVLVEVYDNSGTKKTLTMETVDLYGRTLPEQFIIAAKKDGKWWALPNDLAGTEAAAKAAKAIEIIVDNTTTPTAAIYAPENTLYKAARYYTGPTVANQNRSGVRFTRNGSQYLQVSTVEGTNVMWLSATGGTDVQDWYLDGGTAFANYTIKLDPRMGTGGYKDKKMGIFGSNFGFYTTPTAYDIYLLPVETVLAEAEVVEWGKHSAIIEADAGPTGFNAASVIGRIGDEATTPIAVAETKTSYKGGATKYNYTVNFGNTFDFTTEKDNKLYLDWLNGSGTVVATSMIDIPWIIDGTKTMSVVDGQKTHWSSAEVHVLPGAVLTADAETFSGVTIGTLEIYPGATVKVTTGTLNVSDLVLRYGWTRASGKDYNSAQLQIKRGVGGANLTTTRAYADWYIDYDQFYSMSVPWTVTTSNIRYRNTNSAANTSSVKIRYYDGENRAATGQTQIGQNWKDYNPWPTYLEPSKGYAISAKRPTGKAFSILRMPLTIPSSAWTALGEQGYVESTHKDQVSVTGWGKGTAEWYAMGWNFIGNPYMSTFNGDDSGIIGKLELQNGGTIRYATIPDLGFHNYDQVAIADANILPANGFFIQANDAAAQIVTFNADNIVNPTAPARFTTSSESVPDQEAYIRLSYEGGKDQMGLIIGEDYTENYEANADLAKVLGDAGYVKTYMQYGGMDMAYVAINEELAKAWIPVTVILPANGEYTYSLMSSSEVDELEGVYLIDYANDDKVTNLINENYTFTADAGTISNRFAINAIVGERQIPTDIDVVNEGGDLNSDKPFKFLYHEKVYIYHRGVIYDATGKQVKEINK